MPTPSNKKVVKEFKQGDNSGMLLKKADKQAKEAKANLAKAKENYKKKH